MGIPALHIVRANNGAEYNFYELTGDLPTALHFSDFSEAIAPDHSSPLDGRVRMGDVLEEELVEEEGAEKRITLLD